MKKVYDWNITLNIKMNGQSKTIQIVCSVHTNIHLIKIKIAKKLGLNPLNSQIDIYANGNRLLKSISTLIQNEITKDCILTAKLNCQSNLKASNNQNAENKNLQDGLSVLSCCKNQKCINFQQPTLINIGYGKFDISQIASSLKCSICPYKSQHIQSTMYCKQLLIKRSSYELTSILHVAEGIFKEQKQEWKKVLQQKSLKRQLQQIDHQIGKIIEVRKI